MLELCRDLVAHKWQANALMMSAIRQHPATRSDPDVVGLLHHILLANRFWLMALQGRPFDVDTESRVPPSFHDLVQPYIRTQEQELAWCSGLTEADLHQPVAHPLIPNGSCTVMQAIVQVAMHSHGHRAQCARMLRRHGGTPPLTDFILWLPERPAADWSAVD